MAVVGIDFGCLNSKVRIVCHSYPLRAHPSHPDRRRPQEGHRHYHKRNFKQSYSVCTLSVVINSPPHLPIYRSLISFGVKQRAIGEPAKTQEISNFKNTIGSLKRLLGRTASDPEIADYEKKFINAALVDVNGSVGVKVSHSPFSIHNPI
jgi:molecular chaperone DnaK (HSP70)